MSVRELQLCDKPDCDDKFYGLCVFCGVECCESHLGTDRIAFVLRLEYASSARDAALLGACSFRVCRDCLFSLANTTPVARPLDPVAFGPVVEQTIKARLAGDALAQEKES
jgi:hypothetical protein